MASHLVEPMTFKCKNPCCLRDARWYEALKRPYVTTNAVSQSYRVMDIYMQDITQIKCASIPCKNKIPYVCGTPGKPHLKESFQCWAMPACQHRHTPIQTTQLKPTGTTTICVSVYMFGSLR